MAGLVTRLHYSVERGDYSPPPIPPIFGITRKIIISTIAAAMTIAIRFCQLENVVRDVEPLAIIALAVVSVVWFENCARIIAPIPASMDMIIIA